MLPLSCMHMVASVFILHNVKDVEDVSLVLQSWTLFQLPHQRCKICISMGVSRQVQFSNTVGLVEGKQCKTNALQSESEFKKETKLLYLVLLCV